MSLSLSVALARSEQRAAKHSVRAEPAEWSALALLSQSGSMRRIKSGHYYYHFYVHWYFIPRGLEISKV